MPTRTMFHTTMLLTLYRRILLPLIYWKFYYCYLLWEF